jgi:hypothetical protein
MFIAPTFAVQECMTRLQALPPGPGVSLDDVLQPALDDEIQLRKLFATERQHDRLADPHVGLIDVFDAPDVIRTTRARIVQEPEDLLARNDMPLDEAKREVRYVWLRAWRSSRRIGASSAEGSLILTPRIISR